MSTSRRALAAFSRSFCPAAALRWVTASTVRVRFCGSARLNLISQRYRPGADRKPLCDSALANRDGERGRVGLAGLDRVEPVTAAQGVRGGGHRLEADQLLALGREHLRVRIALLERDLDPAAAALERERPFHAPVAVVVDAIAERARGLVRLLGLARRDAQVVEDQVLLDGQLYLPPV